MQNENICLASEVIEIAEHKTFLELTSRICYYDDVNANNMMLPFDESTQTRAETLVNMPVQARYRTNKKGEPTFGSHEMYKDASGNIVFNTSSIGTHTEIYIQDDTVTTVNGVTKTLPCLFAKYRIWKRYKNVVDATKRLFDLKKLFSSWEILTSAYEFKDGIKKITEYVFEANTLLGFEYATPSYGASASALALATKDSQLMIAEALSQDLISETLPENTEGGNESNMKKEKTTDVSEVTLTPEGLKSENAGVTTNETPNSQTDISQLTDHDLRDRIRKACREKLKKWCWVDFHFPVEKEVWVETDERESELDFVKFTYEVVNDEVSISEPENVQLTVSPKAINTTVAELNTKIADKDDALIKASTEIATLHTTISELQPFKEKFETAEQERIDRETAEKKESLIASITKSKLITKEEIFASVEFKGYVDTLDEKSLKAVVAERFIASLDSKPVNTQSTTATTTETASINLDNVSDEVDDKKSIMKKFLGGK